MNKRFINAAAQPLQDKILSLGITVQNLLITNSGLKLILILKSRIIGDQAGMMVDGEDTYLAFNTVYIEYDIISENSRPNVLATYRLIKLAFRWLFL